MSSGIRKYLFVTVTGIVVVLACFGLGLLPINLFFAKPAISEAVLEHLGAELEVQGPLRLRLGFNPSVTASHITISSIPGQENATIVMERLAVKPGLLNLLGGNIDLRKIQASGIIVDYGMERPPANFPQMFELEAWAARNKPLRVDLIGHSEKDQLKMTATSASLATLLDDPEEFPLALEISGQSSVLQLEGSIHQPLREAKLKAQLDLSSASLSVLLAQFGLDLQEIGSLNIQTTVTADINEIRLENLRGTLGENSFTLSGLFHPFNPRPWIELDATMDHLDLSEFATDESPAAADQEPLELKQVYGVLDQIDGKVSLQLGRLSNAPFSIEEVSVRGRLEEGHLFVENSHLVLAGSKVSARADLDMTLICPRFDSELQISGFDFETLDEFLDTEQSWIGGFETGRLDLASCGGTLNEHLESLTANVALSEIKAHFVDYDQALELSQFQASVGWNKPSRLSLQGEISANPFSISASFGPIGNILDGQELPLDVTVLVEGNKANMLGTGIFLNTDPVLDVVLSVDITKMGALHGWIGTAPENDLPFRGRSRLKLDESGLSINDLEATLGASDFKGDLHIPTPGSIVPMLVQFESKRLNIGELADLIPDEPARDDDDPITGYSFIDENDLITRWLSLPVINLDLAISELDGIAVDANDVRLHAKFSDKLIQDGQLNINFEGVEIAGLLDADLRAQPYQVNVNSTLSNIDVGRLLKGLELAENVDAQADKAIVSIVSSGNTIRGLLTNSTLDATLDNLRWGFQAGPENSHFDIELSRLELLASPSSDTTWQTSGTLNGVPLKVWMKTPGLLETFDPTADLPATLAVGTGNDIFMLEGVINRASGRESITHLTLSGAYGDPVATDFSELQSPLEDFEFQAELSVKDSTYKISNLEARVGSSRINGAINFKADNEANYFDIELRSPFLETDDLVQWVEDIRKTRQALIEEEAGIIDETAANAGLVTLLNRYIDEFSDENVLNLNVKLDELRSSGELLGHGQLELMIDGQNFLLDPIELSFPGGNVDVSYSGVKQDDGFRYLLNIDVERLEYGGLLRLFDPDANGSGALFLDVDLESKAPDWPELLNNLAGTVDFVVFPEDIEAGFLDLWASNLIFALLPSISASGKKLNCMVTRFDVEDGVMTSKKSFLDSTDIIVRARGEIDLANRKLDLLVAPQAKVEKFLSVSTPIAVTGSFDDYTVGVAPGGFLTTMFRLYLNLIYVPWKWMTGDRFPADGVATCYDAMGWAPPEGH